MKIKAPRHGSRSTSKGKIVTRCPCGGLLKITMVDHYNFIAECSKCGNVREDRRMPNGVSTFEMNKGRR